MFRTILTFVLLAGISTASAAEISVLSAGAVEGGLVRLIEQFRQTTGHIVRVQYGTSPELTEHLAAAQSADVLIAPAAVMDRAIADRKVAGDTRATVGRVGIGVIVRAGAKVPDLPSPDALRRAFLEADAIVYNRGSSGLYIEKLLAQMEIAEQVRPRTAQVADGEDVMRRIIDGKADEIGLAAISAIKIFKSSGFRYVGPLPAPIQNLTTYVAAVMNGAREPRAAAEFVQFITAPSAGRIFLEAGVE
jgi:molybdate transport system substrate-binding protein